MKFKQFPGVKIKVRKNFTIDLDSLSNLYTREFEKVEKRQEEFMSGFYNKIFKNK